MTLNKREKETLARYRLEKAEKVLADARLLLKEKRVESSINRSYYAALSAAKAALIIFGIDPKTHEGVKAMLNKELILPGLLPKEFAKWFRKLQFEREDADYGDYTAYELPDAQNAYQEASSFIDKIKEIIPSLLDQV